MMEVEDMVLMTTTCLRYLMRLKVIYFQSIFLIDFYIKRPIYMQEAGINFTKISVQQEIQKKAEIAVKRSRMWPSSDDIIGCNKLQ